MNWEGRDFNLSGKDRWGNPQGFTALEEVGGKLAISGVNSIAGLSQLKSVGSDLVLDGNVFDSLDGLENLKSLVKRTLIAKQAAQVSSRVPDLRP